MKTMVRIKTDIHRRLVFFLRVALLALIITAAAPVLPGTGAGGTAQAAYRYRYGSQLSGNTMTKTMARRIYSALVKHYIREKKVVCFQVSFKAGYRPGFHVDRWGYPIKDQAYQKGKELINKAYYMAMKAFEYDYPQAAWMADWDSWDAEILSLWNADTGKGVFTGLSFKNIYYLRGVTVGSFNAKTAGSVRTIRKKARRAGNSRYAKVVAIHDYVCRKLTYYDSGEDICSSAAAGYWGGYGVCTAYAKLFKALCDRMNIPCVCVVGKVYKSSSGPGNHMWNYVKMEDGNWYLVDTTWDDQSWGIMHDYLLIGSRTRPKHETRIISATRKRSANMLVERGYVKYRYPTLHKTAYRPKRRR